MSAITMETSYVNADGDMGQEYIVSHSKQHDYLLSGEKEVIVLSNTKLEEKSQDLALKKAIEQVEKSDVFSSNGDNQNSEITPTYY